MTKAICWFIHFSWKNIIGYTPLIGKQNRHKYHSKQSFIGYYCAETYMRASISRRKPIANMMLLRYIATVGDMAQWQKQRQWGTEGKIFPPCRAPPEAKVVMKGIGWGSISLWIQLPVSHCEPISLTFLLQPLSLAPGRNENFQLYLAARYCDNLHKD